MGSWVIGWGSGTIKRKIIHASKFPYNYTALEPYISKRRLTLHHTKHHQAYVTGANANLEKLDKARKEKADLDIEATLKELSFHIGGFRLRTTFWENLARGSAVQRRPGESNR